MGITYEAYRELLSRTDPNADCPVKRLLAVFSGKWHTRVIFELTRVDSARFGELRRSIGGITSTMLASTLRELEESGIVQRTQYNEIPPRVEYALTEAGRALYPVFYEMALWGSRYLPRKTPDGQK